MNQLLCILLFSVATGCASVENKTQVSEVSTFESPKVNHRTLSVRKPWKSGPHPTIIIGHGCDGLRTNPALFDWASTLNSWGYNAVLYDSFAHKGYDDGRICPDALLISPEYRAREAQEAAKWIKQQPWHTGKVGYIGISHGGTTAIRLGMLSPETNEISASIAMYPWCHIFALGQVTLNKEITPPEWGYFMKTPTQIHLAGADDWTPPIQCKDIKNAGMYEYEGATHAFDLAYPDRTMFGYRLKYNGRATSLAKERIKKFLSENM